MSSRRRFSRDRQGRVHPRLERPERELLEVVARQTQEQLAAQDAATARVHPVAYPNDPEAEAEFKAIMGEGLRDRHQRALDALAVGVGADVVEEPELHQWMEAVEVMRLVLGTELDVTEEMDAIDQLDPRAGQFALYAYLSVLQNEIVEALSASLPASRDEDDE
ncbi:MAG TPA: DUF2017 family protein [Acidimicrobiales bacterium]|nr:DUF2017 family protein [Acidimicrobiales bacterium]